MTPERRRAVPSASIVRSTLPCMTVPPKFGGERPLGDRPVGTRRQVDAELGEGPEDPVERVVHVEDAVADDQPREAPGRGLLDDLGHALLGRLEVVDQPVVVRPHARGRSLGQLPLDLDAAGADADLREGVAALEHPDGRLAAVGIAGRPRSSSRAARRDPGRPECGARRWSRSRPAGPRARGSERSQLQGLPSESSRRSSSRCRPPARSGRPARSRPRPRAPCRRARAGFAATAPKGPHPAPAREGTAAGSA